MKINIENEQLSFQALRMLSEISSEQADVNEVLDTAKNIKSSYESWYDEWVKTADKVRNIADDFLAHSHNISAAETYLRASNYYRAAGFYHGVLIVEGCSEETKRKLEHIDDLALDCFSKVIQYGSTSIEPLKIPCGEMTLPGHFYKVSAQNYKSAPTLILITGYDGTKEEEYGYALSALKRGMNCLAFEGPGQGEMIRKKGIPFRPDWENVVTPVIDYLIGTLKVCPDKIVLWGESMGGYLAPRAAGFDHRVAACVANSGVYDFMGAHIPAGMDRETCFKTIANMSESEVDAILKNQMSKYPQVDWALKHGMYVFGVENLKEFFLKSKEYYLDGIAQQIKCPMLVTDCENENNFPGQAKQLYEALHCPKKYLLFTKAQGAAAHCQQGAKIYANGCIFNWIEDQLQNR